MERWVVADLARADEVSWDEDMVGAIFSERDATAILNLKPLEVGVEDKVIWRWSKDGVYTVRTAYQALMEDRV
ncbi:hypothetical protein LINPERHAP2_LOCUS36181 [Linum perenne]